MPSLNMPTMSSTITSTELSDSNRAIDSFVDDEYKTGKVYFWKLLTKYVEEECRNMLGKQSIQAILSSRVKDPESLRKKLRNINSHSVQEGRSPFKGRTEIINSIYDFGGVRIALYVPHQKDAVIRELMKLFKGGRHIPKRGKVKDIYICKTCKQERKSECEQCRNIKGTSSCTVCGQDMKRECDQCRSRTESDKESVNTPSAIPRKYTIDGNNVSPDAPDDNPVFAGYIADHIRVKLSPTQAARAPLDLYEDEAVEIQVVSVLLHAWAEVEHDIIYKQIKSEASKEERKILECLNGLVMSSEILLDQLHVRRMDRIESAKKAFSNKFELAIFLEEYIGGILKDDEKNNLELKMLFGLLKVLELNTREQLQPLLENMGFTETGKDRLTDVKSLGETYTSLFSKQDFRLAQHMRIPFYIMERILSAQSIEVKNEAEYRTANTWEDSLQCCILLSSILWMAQLTHRGSIERLIDSIEKVDAKETEAFEWPLTAPSRYAILVNKRAPKEQDRELMQIMWNWFERKEKEEPDSLFSFVFRISKLGVVGSFPDDLAPFRRG